MPNIDFRLIFGHLWGSKWVPLGSSMHLWGAIGSIFATLESKKRVLKEHKSDFIRIIKIAIFLCDFEVF